MIDRFKCGGCGQKELVILKDLPNLKNGEYGEQVGLRASCSNCNNSFKICSRFALDSEKGKCVSCGNKQMRASGNNKLCSDCSHKFTCSLEYRFGVIIPGETGTIYTHQTGGVACRTIYIEGSFIPLRIPKDENGTSILSHIQSCNYSGSGSHRGKSLRELWSDVKDRLGIDFERVSSPEGQPDNTEGLKWVKFTATASPIDSVKGDWRAKLVDENRKVALIYPNSD